MTREEAVEHVLRGPLVACSMCSGRSVGGCRNCRFFGYFLIEEYEEACRLLGLPPPPEAVLRELSKMTRADIISTKPEKNL